MGTTSEMVPLASGTTTDELQRIKSAHSFGEHTDEELHFRDCPRCAYRLYERLLWDGPDYSDDGLEEPGYWSLLDEVRSYLP